LLVAAISMFNIVLAYVFGNNGYEAFVTLSIALGILITWQSLQLLRLLFKSHTWLILKLLGAAALGFFWFLVIGGVMLSISRDAYDPSATTPDVNWLVVLIGTVPYLLPRLGLYKTDAGFTKTAIGTVTTLYSVIVLFVAALGFYDSEARYQSLILVLAVQLQYLMNHVILNTGYLDRALAAGVQLSSQLKLGSSSFGRDLTIFLVAIPFFAPLAIVLLAGVIGQT
jgi:hypothetical protein